MKKEKKMETRLLPTSIISYQNSDMENILIMMEKLLHWAAIVESSDDAIISKSIEGYITSWNKGAQRLYGYTADEIIGKPVSILMPPEREDDFPKIMKQLHEGKRIEHYETKRKTKDGRVLDVSITVSPIRDKQGKIIGASKIARDISDRIENEKRRDQFVSTASHELKTPLTSQKLFGDMLEELIIKNKDENYLPYIKNINLQNRKLTKLVEDLLELSRLQAGKLNIQKEIFSMKDLIDEIVTTTKLTMKQEIVTQKLANKKVKADRERIGQVLTNLITNAIKYSPDSECVNISSVIKDNTIVIAVQDFGIGIAKEYHEKIFERFYRIDGEDERTYPGMGIGLNLCKEILDLHHGKIWVKSEKGKGATFYFSLPFVN